MERVRVRRRDHVRPRPMDARVNRERSGIDRIIALDHLARFIDQNEIRRANMSEVHAERIHPKARRELGVARGDMPGDAFVESESREESEGCREALFTMPPLLGERSKDG